MERNVNQTSVIKTYSAGVGTLTFSKITFDKRESAMSGAHLLYYSSQGCVAFEFYLLERIIGIFVSHTTDVTIE